MAGAEVVSDNYLTNPNASLHGQLSFNPGLNLLSTMVIIPNTYLYSTDYYENTNSAIPWGMLEKQIYRGVWLTVRNFMKYYVEFPYSYITVYGESPAMILTSQEGGYDLNAQIFRNRQVAGFEQMDFQTLLYPNTIQVGDVVYGIESPGKNNSFSAYYNPSSQEIIIRFESLLSENAVLELYNLNGQLIHSVNRNLMVGEQSLAFKASGLNNGLYLLKLQTQNSVMAGKIMVLH
jgi:hypothetical protein